MSCYSKFSPWRKINDYCCPYLLVILLSFANGANDVSKGIATLVGSGITNYRRAIIWGTFWTMAGAIVAAFFALEVVKTFSAGGIVKSTPDFNEMFPISVTLGAFIWIIFASKTGLPVSTTHAITGAICGVGIAAVGFTGIAWPVLGKKIFLPLAFSPVAALGISWLFFPIIRMASSRAQRYCVCLEVREEVSYRGVLGSSGAITAASQVTPLPQATLMAAEKNVCRESFVSPIRLEVVDLFHWLSAGMTSFARGLNDAPKIAALAFGLVGLGVHQDSTLYFVGIAVAMGIGSVISGLRVTETLTEKVTPMNPKEGFAANLTTSILVGIAARLGLPVSTTHISSGAIIAIGLKRGKETVKWKVVFEMILAWIVTLPVSALIALLAFWILTRIN
ncbi:MAG TPA: inorganic phosphate transporter [Thermodesulfobacteriota bacterium]|nr:inorganic phosphate transporter [Thermodesulfobacteriota bacterium]